MVTEIIKIEGNIHDNTSLDRAAKIIKNGGLVVFPTETVYGLGADATSEEAAGKIYNAKGRPSDNPLIIHIADPRWADEYAYTDSTYYRLAEHFMPGPLTVVMRSRDTVPQKTRGGLDTVAVRCPSNEVARALIEKCGVPIAAPSANLSGSPSPTTVSHVIDDMLDRVDMIIDGGDSSFGLESTIVKIDGEDKVTLLRPGKITIEDISSLGIEVTVADAVVDKLGEGEVALSPGMKYRHYAPKAPLVLIDGGMSETANYIKAENHGNIAIIAFSEDVPYFEKELPDAAVYNFSCKSDLEGQAHTIFYLLREIDKKQYDKIYAPLPQKEGIGLALFNRMIRAAAHQIIKL